MPDPTPLESVIVAPTPATATVGTVRADQVAVVAAPITRPTSSALSSGVRNGIGGALVYTLGRLIAEQWLVPGASGLFAAANPSTLSELTGALPIATGGAFLAGWAALGTVARDVAFYANSRWGKIVGSIAS